jgi:hypothetical protein
VAYYALSGEVSAFNPGFDNSSDTISFPLSDVYRSSVDVYDTEYWWLGGLGNGSQIANGNYTYVFQLLPLASRLKVSTLTTCCSLRFAVLAPFGDRTHSDNWDVLSHKFSIVSK